jgi:hypothetical protein
MTLGYDGVITNEAMPLIAQKVRQAFDSISHVPILERNRYLLTGALLI